jgi:ferredoxin
MKVKVIGDRCTGHGRCWAVAPELFEPDEEGFNSQLDTTIEVPAGKEQEAQDAVLSCPEGALEVVE